MASQHLHRPVTLQACNGVLLDGLLDGDRRGQFLLGRFGDKPLEGGVYRLDQRRLLICGYGVIADVCSDDFRGQPRLDPR